MDYEDVAEKIIYELSSRAGFDKWWDSIKEDVQQEIKEDLKNMLKIES